MSFRCGNISGNKLVLTLSARSGVLCGGGVDGSGGEAATMSGLVCIGLKKLR